MPLSPSSVKIIQATDVTDELFQACQTLIPQLSSNNSPPSHDDLARMLSEDSLVVFLAIDKEHDDEKIIGLASLVLYQVPTGKRGIIEDVVVDKNARGKGVGEALTRACLRHAERVGVPQVMLTSNPDRQSANRLYQRMGFELRITNVYRYRFNRD